MDISRPLTVVAPTLDADVLFRLVRARGTAFTAGQLQRLIPGRSVDGVRRTLERLAAQGVVLATPVGHAVTYRLNPDHLAADAITLLAEQPAQLVDRLSQHISEWPEQPLYVAIFGSWARFEATVASDIDLLVVLPSASDPIDLHRRIRVLEDRVHAWTGNDARALFVHEDQVRHDPSFRPVLENAQRDGLWVAGDEHWLARALRTRATA